jgi:hypothetical protein
VPFSASVHIAEQSCYVISTKPSNFQGQRCDLKMRFTFRRAHKLICVVNGDAAICQNGLVHCNYARGRYLIHKNRHQTAAPMLSSISTGAGGDQLKLLST